MKVKLTTGLLCGTCNHLMHVSISPKAPTMMYCSNYSKCEEAGVLFDLPELEVTIHAELVGDKQ